MNDLLRAADYLGSQRRLAALLGITPATVNQWVMGIKPVPQERAATIERLTDGSVTADILRPDVRWIRVPDVDWPHPSGRPCVDVAAPAPSAEPA